MGTRELKRLDIGSFKSLTDLCDELLSHILYFLPLKEAIRTSILSKRWQYLWTPIPILDFTQKESESTEDFMNFIERAFSLRGSSKLTKFKLKGRMGAWLPVEALVSAATRCNVEDCELHLRYLEEPLFFPYSFHNLATLTHLHIEMNYERLIVHPSICLPNLKTLDLCYVILFEEKLVQSLFSGCHSLENLHLKHCHWEDMHTMRISCAKLQKLIIDEELHEDPYEPLGDEFVIHGDNLRYFSYSGQFFFKYHILNCTSLEELYLKVDSLPNQREVSRDRLIELLKCLNLLYIPKFTWTGAIFGVTIRFSSPTS